MSTRDLPGSKLLGWPNCLAAAVILVNDIWLKWDHSGWLSGKLSDFGICFFLPVWLYSSGEFVLWVTRLDRSLEPRFWLIASSCLVSGAYFSALQLSGAFAEWHVRTLEGLFGMRFVVTPDPTDLITLVMLPLAWLYLRSDPFSH